MPRSLLLSAVLAALWTLVSAPPAQITVSLPASKDNSLFADRQSFSNGSGERLFTGRTLRRLLRRALIAFDVSSIPQCATVTSVQLVLTIERTQAPPLPVDLHRVLTDWGEGASNAGASSGLGQGGGAGVPAVPPDATWNHSMFPNRFWTNSGGDYVATPSASAVAAGFGTVTLGSTPQLVADVQGWVDDPSTSFGWMILTDEVMIPSARVFASREHRSPGRRPSLIVSYTTAGVIPRGVGCTGTGASPYTLSANGLPTSPNPAFSLAFSGGPATTAEAAVLTSRVLFTPLPFGQPGCTLQVETVPPWIVVIANNGVASVPVPPMPLQGCVPLAAQGVGIDAVANDLVTTNALILLLGR